MSTRIQIEYCGMSGAGATVKEAKQDAGKFAIESVAVINAPESSRKDYEQDNYPIPTIVIMAG